MNASMPYLDLVSAHRSTSSSTGGERQVGPEHTLAALLREHGPREGEALEAYARLVEVSEDPAVRYLGSLILEDERRHHKMIDEMLHQIESFLWEVDRDPQVPYLTPRVDPELRAALDELIEIERTDAKELRQLRRQMRGQPATSLLPLLVELMMHDTEKHLAILKLLRSHTAAR